MLMDRKEHIKWCKKRALEYLDNGDLTNAYISIVSDLRKHPDTENHPAIQVGVGLLFGEQLGTSEQMRKFIEGFN